MGRDGEEALITLGTVRERGRGKLQKSLTPSNLANSASGEQRKEMKSCLDDGKRGLAAARVAPQQSPGTWLRVLNLC